jgi:hypothetical protein
VRPSADSGSRGPRRAPNAHDASPGASDQETRNYGVVEQRGIEPEKASTGCRVRRSIERLRVKTPTQ